jgi:hypothetical protein
MHSVIATAARLGAGRVTTMQCTCRAAAALQRRGVASAQQTFTEDAYDVVVFGGGMVGVAFAALLGACTCTAACVCVHLASAAATAARVQVQNSEWCRSTKTSLFPIAPGVHPVTRSLRVAVIDRQVCTHAPVQRLVVTCSTRHSNLATTACRNSCRHDFLHLCVAQKLSDQQPPMDQAPNARVSTITPASASILDRIGAWTALAPPVSAAFGSMQVRTAAETALLPLACCLRPSEGRLHPRQSLPFTALAHDPGYRGDMPTGLGRCKPGFHPLRGRRCR